MALSFVRRSVTQAENKLRLLLCLQKVGFCTMEQLWPFVASLELMEYIPFCLYMAQMRESGEIAGGNAAMEGQLFVTVKGEKTLQLFSGKILQADRQEITQKAPAYAELLSEKRQVSCGYERTDNEQTYGMYGYVREGDIPTLQCHIQTDDIQLCNTAVELFRTNAAQFLRLLYTQEVTDTKQALPVVRDEKDAPIKPFLIAYGANQYGAVIESAVQHLQCTLQLLFPDQEYAACWACSVSGKETIAMQFFEMLNAEARHE